jgi:transcriptional regulator with XRE-family HTH domain
MTFLFPPILAQLSTRLKAARQKLGLKQAELAVAGGVTRTAQVRYESGETAPSTDYLHGIQSTGIDIPYVLYGYSGSEIVDSALNSKQIALVDWHMIRQAFQDVEFFCEQYAPKCPMGYRWEMVAEIYDIHQAKLANNTPMNRHARQQMISELWNEK